MPRTKQLHNLEDKIPVGVSRDKTVKHQIHKSILNSILCLIKKGTALLLL